MAQHGYLGDGYGTEYDPDYDADDDRRRERDQRESNWRDDRDFMFDDSRGRRPGYDDPDRGPFGSWGNDARSWFRDKPDGEPGRLGARENDRWRSSDADEWFGGRPSARSLRSSQDDHYRSWRDRHMEAVDRDYEDYCREREQQFHQDFDSWRSQRRGNPEPLRTGMTQTGLAEDPSGVRQAENEADETPSGGSDPMATATLGTTSRGRSRG